MLSYLSRTSLRTAVAVGMVILSIGLTFFIALPGSYLLLRNVKDIEVARWDNKVDEVAKALTEPLRQTDLAELHFMVVKEVKQPAVVGISVYAYANRLVAHATTPSSKNLPSTVLSRRLDDKNGVQIGRLEVSFLTAAYYSASEKHLLILILILLILTMVLALGGYALVSRLTRPILSMQCAIEHFELGAWEKIRPQGVVELRRLGAGLNKMADRITLQATTDSVTGTLNRQALENRLQLEISQINRASQVVLVAFIDLDHFKNINDTFGHSGGDEVLFQICRRLERVLPEHFSIGRFGGDEFVLFGTCSSIEALQVAREIPLLVLSCIEKPFDIGHRSVLVTASVGTAVAPQDGRNAAAILSASDIALYKAKRGGRAKHVAFNASQEQSVHYWVSCGEAVRFALEQGKVKHVVQPIYFANSLALWGGESLLRIHSVNQEPVPATMAVEAADQLGLTQELSYATVVNVGRILKYLKRNVGRRLIITINFSKAQLLNSDGPIKLASLLSEIGVPLSQVVLEITEEALLSEKEVKKKLESIRRLGFALALDDFGSGYSSLACIREIPLSYVKLDKSFIKDLHSNEKSRRLFRGTVSLLHQLELVVIAEGVETQQQLDVVREAGCQMVQGRLLGKPAPVSELIREPAILNG